MIYRLEIKTRTEISRRYRRIQENSFSNQICFYGFSVIPLHRNMLSNGTTKSLGDTVNSIMFASLNRPFKWFSIFLFSIDEAFWWLLESTFVLLFSGEKSRFVPVISDSAKVHNEAKDDKENANERCLWTLAYGCLVSNRI